MQNNRTTAALVLLLLSSLPGCNETAIYLEVHSQLRIPQQLDALCLQIAGGGELEFSRRYPLGTDDAGRAHSLSVVAGEKNPAGFELLLWGELRGWRVSWLRQQLSFEQGEVLHRDIYIRACQRKKVGGGFTTGGRLTSGKGSVVAAMPALLAPAQMVALQPGETRRFALLERKVHQLPGTLPRVTGAGPVRRVLATDLDGDCDQDLLLLHPGGPELWLNDGAGGFSKQANALAAGDYRDAAAADLDGDGLVDLVLVSPSRSTLLLSSTQSPGTFTDASTRLPAAQMNAATSVAVGLIDEDNHPDLLVGRGDTAAATNLVLHNDDMGQGIFTKGAAPPDKQRTSVVALADLNGDDRHELVFGEAAASTVAYSRSKGKFSKLWTAPSSTAGGVLDILAADLDDDCHVDLVLAREAGVRLFYNQGNTSTGTPRLVEQSLGKDALGARNLAAFDVTGNGLQDLVLGGNALGAIWLRHNQ